MRCLGHYSEALSCINKALTLDAKNGWILAVRGRIYHALNQIEEASADLAQAVQYDPADWIKAAKVQVEKAIEEKSKGAKTTQSAKLVAKNQKSAMTTYHNNRNQYNSESSS